MSAHVDLIMALEAYFYLRFLYFWFLLFGLSGMMRLISFCFKAGFG